MSRSPATRRGRGRSWGADSRTPVTAPRTTPGRTNDDRLQEYGIPAEDRLPDARGPAAARARARSEEHTSELQSLMRISYAVFCLKKKKVITHRDVMTKPIRITCNTTTQVQI